MTFHPVMRNMTLAKVRLFDRLAAAYPQYADIRNLKLPWYCIYDGCDPNNPKRKPNNSIDAEPTEVAPASEETDIFIYDEIGGSFGTNAEQFVMDLQGITTPRINIRINSPGGSAWDAIAMHNALRLHQSHVTTYVDSLAASAASIVAMGGDRIVMMPGGQLMIHDALSSDMGNAADHRAIADFLDEQSDNLASIYAYKAGGQVRSWRAKMKAETWYTAGEAIEAGLADELYQDPGRNPSKRVKQDVDEAVESGVIIIPGEDEEDAEDPGTDPAKPASSLDVMRALVSQKHRLTNRGYRYIGRNGAPDPRQGPTFCVPDELVTETAPDPHADPESLKVMMRLLGGR